jgi:hypothetical protein
MKYIIGSDFTLSWICFISSLHVNEVDFKIGFQTVMSLLHLSLRVMKCNSGISFQTALNLLHLAVYAINEVDLGIGFQAVLSLLHLIAYASMK